LYLIEDGGTGYLDDFSDGRKFALEGLNSQSLSVTAAETPTQEN